MFVNKLTILAIILAFFIDCILGDPQNILHPIRILGYINNVFIKLYDKIKIKNRYLQFFYGMFMNIAILCLVFVCIKGLKLWFYSKNIWLGFLFETIFAYFIIAPKCLYTESMKIYKALKDDDILKARKYLSYIVGRDTEKLEEDKIIKATIETIAENLCDGVIAPLFYLFLGGVPLGMVYKAINTLDSMVGYKNEKFYYFGKFSARVDDIFNFIPARISAFLMILASFILRLDYKNAIKIYIRDRYNHLSPNSAHTEAVCSGSLGLELGGSSYYKGVLVEKKTIGDEKRKPTIKDIKITNILMYVSSIIFIAIMICIFW